MIKVCTKCSISKPIEEYSKHPNSRSGYYNICKACNVPPANAFKPRGRITQAAPAFKKCKQCKHTHPIEHYYEHKQSADGHSHICKTCKPPAPPKPPRKIRLPGTLTKEERAWEARCRWVKHKYGLSKEQYKAMLDAHDGLCDICRDPIDVTHLDHCHATGKVRGLLCSYCNHGLGQFKDSISRLLNAAEYLRVKG
jgi:hypothetical protein